MKGSEFSSWPTASASLVNDGESPDGWQARRAAQKARHKNGNGMGMPLTMAAQMWTTPQAHDVTARGSGQKPSAKAGNACLATDAQVFSRPGPATCAHGLPPSQWRPTSRRLLRSVTSHVKRTSLRRWLRRGNWKKRRLNPLFVEWLMGWPPGHALCDCSATEFARWQRDMRGALSALPTASAAWIWEPSQEAARPEQLRLFQ